MAVSTVVLVEDDAPTRASLAAMLAEHPELRLLAAVGSCAEARRELGRKPTVLLLDLGLPDGDGMDLIRVARRADPPILPIVLTVFGDERHVVAAIEAGALGYLVKADPAEHVCRSILDTVAGGSPISPSIARHLLQRMRRDEAGAPADAATLPRLSERERQVLTLIVKGFTYPEIAALLGVSAHSVATYVRRIYGKLDVGSRAEAVYEALQLGLVRLDE